MLGFTPLADAPLGDSGTNVYALTATSITTGTPSVASPSLTQILF